MTKYGWAINEMKLQRAIAQSKGDESLVFDLYVSYGGKVKEGYEAEKPKVEMIFTQEIPKTPAEDVAESQVVVPKRRGRPAKNAK